ncbi:hypothetical protein E8D34_17480 [Nocardioides sp. GY 10113]|uniref:hypothetical protein n=1 Tax=Nocardioides sp. GY 10113 TaxID=2569761 RepID=UPI0010A7CDF4|nr:hypothetical protein [Nocardioides sp. GY 10113]TIC81478.1 hypothetical protein E8D34_17480 [Nocardioides sp. GY 10113]
MARRRRIRRVVVDPASGRVVSPWPFAGLVLMAASFFLYAASGPLVPWWVLIALLSVWAGLLAACLRAFHERPRRPVWLGLASVGVWALVVVGGGIAFGWGG